MSTPLAASAGSGRPERIRLTFVRDCVSADAALRWDRAPETCAALVGALPVAGLSHHATYSGSEAVLILPDMLRVAPERATADVSVGDVAFTWFDVGDAHGVTHPFAEIAWFYDVDARPSMHEGPAPMTLFASLVGDASAFFEVSRAMRRGGVTALAVEVVDADQPTVARHVLHRCPEGGDIGPPLLARTGSELVVAFTETAVLGTDVEPRARLVVGRSADDGATWTMEHPLPHRSGVTAVGWRPDGNDLQLEVADHHFEADPSPAAPGWAVSDTTLRTVPIASGSFQLGGVTCETPGGLVTVEHAAGAITATTPRDVRVRVHVHPGIDADVPTTVALPDGRVLTAYRAWDAPSLSDPPVARRTVRVATFDPS